MSVLAKITQAAHERWPAVKESVLTWGENVLFLQAVCTLVSMPILYNWEMSCSKVSILGNMFFSPFMAFFIILSGIIFVLGLVGIQLKIIFWVFEKFVASWTWMLHFGSKHWLVCPDRFMLLLWVAGASGFGWLVFKGVSPKKLRKFSITWLAIFSVTIIVPIHTGLLFKGPLDLVKGRRNITAKRTEKGLVLADDGAFGRCQEPEKFVLFSLRPFVLKNFGTLSVDGLVLKRLSRRALRAAVACCQFLDLKKVKLPRLWSVYHKDHEAEIDGLIDQLKASGVCVVDKK